MDEEKKVNLMTKEGKKKLEDELQDLKLVQRPAIAKKIGEAREQGDLSENAEYDAAKDEQGKIEDRITDIEEILKYAVVADDDGQDTGKINIGYTVKLLDVELKEEETFDIVGSNEVDILNNRISNESPVGAAVIGHEPGQTVTVETEAGSFEYKILEAHRTRK
ncbi:MAG: transcription elongation factor GreA [Lachnospiraceae bacterium]|uniref:Transcription elongation factor GreA n=1 Tax=Candidatus Weimeria bifida TaxID=2599074 RepID=A0A6N7J0J9_9FIRM|nr:transcription elongation factor GreA [Candidatus Weimeria bifida]RRF96813.1 MAG: transcription elongation factor GreA [Lachnospiraceae bacterium]